MTKQVRIENADIGDKKIVVEVWEERTDGAPDQLVSTQILAYPTAMTNDLFLTSTRYLLVREGTS